MNILMIGNGFDLYHGLRTKYSDFLNFVEQINRSSLDNVFSDKEIELFRKNYSNKEKAEFLRHLYQENIWYEYLRGRYKANQMHMQNWIDFEREIEHVIILLEKNFRYQNRINDDDIDAIKAFDFYKKQYPYVMHSYIFSEYEDKNYSKAIDSLKSELDDFIKGLSIYLHYYIEEISMNDMKELTFVKSLLLDNVHVLSFNYTHLFDKAYQSSKVQEICFIHGEAKDDGKNMVLGIEEYLNDDEKNKQLMFVSYKKFFQRIVKGTSNIYIRWLKDCKKVFDSHFILNENGLSHITIFGHSLDPTDGDIIKKLIDNEFMNTRIYYLNEIDLESKVMNLIKVIGEDHLIDKTSSGQIVFEKIPEKY